jgi:hypothetical protein
MAEQDYYEGSGCSKRMPVPGRNQEGVPEAFEEVSS